MKKIIIFTLLALSINLAAFSQGSRVRWKRQKSAQLDLQLLHSTFAINLPTAETLQKGDFEFEISHRFLPAVSTGSETLFGVDGPVNMRLALGYAPSNRLVVTLGRSNVEDNIDLSFRYKALQLRNNVAPVLLSFHGGVAYTSGANLPLTDNSKRRQYYAQLVLNTLIGKRIGLGLVPSYLHNAHIYCPNTQYSLVLGSYVQFYVSPLWSVLAEWMPTLMGWRRWHNTLSLGIELETGGHFFKIFVTNNRNLNPSQSLTGADLDFDAGDYRFGFMITRLLKFAK